eukprot:1142191-Pelagomonas_calceolata.AAC.5
MQSNNDNINEVKKICHYTNNTRGSSHPTGVRAPPERCMHERDEEFAGVTSSAGHTNLMKEVPDLLVVPQRPDVMAARKHVMTGEGGTSCGATTDP